MERTKTKTISNSQILIVDDHRNIRASLRLTLEGEGARIIEADTCKSAIEKLGTLPTDPDNFPYHAVLLDIRLPDGSGLDLLKALSESKLASRVIMISGEGTITDAFQATQMGAFDYIEKPFGEERIIVCVERCIDFNRMQIDNKKLTKEVLKGKEILGDHPKVREIHTLVDRIAPTNSRVLITGESGTGKELVARAIHRHSTRAKKPLIKVNCAAIPPNLIESELFGHEKGSFTGAHKMRKGVFERADKATLFLDEVGELSADIQAKLLRVLQNGEFSRVGAEEVLTVDVRLIAATNRDLSEMVKSGEFREDLFYRLNVVGIETPPLRERASDIEVLAEAFLSGACGEHSLGERSFSKDALKQLIGHNWPGNIRELKNVIERMAILSEDAVLAPTDSLGPVIKKPDAAEAVADAPAGGEFSFGCDVVPWQEFHEIAGRAYIKHALTKAKGNVSEAARILCLERAYLHRLMKKLGVQRSVVVQEQ